MFRVVRAQAVAAQWLPDRCQQHQHKQAGCGHVEENRLPGRHDAKDGQHDVGPVRNGADNRPPDHVGNAEPEVGAHDVRAGRAGDEVRPEIIGDQRIGRRIQGCFSETGRRPRARNRWVNVRAMPHRAVIALQSATPMAMMPTRWRRSASRPMGKPMSV